MKVFIRGVRVDRRRQDRLVASETLGESDVLGPVVDRRAGRMAQNVEAHVAVETRASLPDAEALAELPRGRRLAVAVVKTVRRNDLCQLIWQPVVAHAPRCRCRD